MRLSVLDQAPVTKGNTGVEALQKSEEELAILADEPRLSAHVDGRTPRHEITCQFSAGNNSSKTGSEDREYPYRRRRRDDDALSTTQLAEVFKTLSAFSPGRIDFGVGRAPVRRRCSIRLIRRTPSDDGYYA